MSGCSKAAGCVVRAKQKGHVIRYTKGVITACEKGRRVQHQGSLMEVGFFPLSSAGQAVSR